MSKPIRKFRNGRISAAIWENQKLYDGEETQVYNIKVSKSYTDKEGKWHTTDSLNVSEIPKAISVLAEAYRALTVIDESVD